jgi:hypothetical protein
MKRGFAAEQTAQGKQRQQSDRTLQRGQAGFVWRCHAGLLLFFARQAQREVFPCREISRSKQNRRNKAGPPVSNPNQGAPFERGRSRGAPPGFHFKSCASALTFGPANENFQSRESRIQQ